MKLKVHVAADQLTQWWDGFIRAKSKKVSRINQSTRYYLAMSFLKSEEFLVQKDASGDDASTWELETAAPLRWRELDVFRHIERDELAISNEEVKIYTNAMIDALTLENFKKGSVEIDGVLRLFVDGIVEGAHWSGDGLLNFSVTRFSAERFGLREGDVFQSPIGRRWLPPPIHLDGPSSVSDPDKSGYMMN